MWLSETTGLPPRIDCGQTRPQGDFRFPRCGLLPASPNPNRLSGWQLRVARSCLGHPARVARGQGQRAVDQDKRRTAIDQGNPDQTSDPTHNPRLPPGAFVAAALPARAAEKCGPGVTDTEIKIGNTGPYSGPLANASPFPLSEKAYFEMINAEGGINGRKITWISYDDGYSPPKTVEMTRRLVEEDNVLCLSGSIGTRPTARFGTT